MYDKLSFLKGLALGLAGKPLEFAPGKEPVAYLYNGVRLPKLPEWDESKYPYVSIDLGTMGLSNAILRCTERPLISDGDRAVTDGKMAQYVCNHYEGETAWADGREASLAATFASSTIVWANYDIVNPADGTILLAVSDPIPVYE